MNALQSHSCRAAAVAVAGVALRGEGKTLAPLLIQLVCFWTVGMPLGLRFAFRMHEGAVGMWWGLSLGLAPAALALLWQWRRLSKTAVRET